VTKRVFYSGYSESEGKKPKYREMEKRPVTAGKASGDTFLRRFPARNKLNAMVQRKPFG